MTTAEQVAAWLARYKPPHPELKPAELWVSSDVFVELHTTPDYGDGRMVFTERIYGLDVHVDASLESGTWRVCTLGGTLLHDSRSPERARR